MKQHKVDSNNMKTTKNNTTTAHLQVLFSLQLLGGILRT